MNPLSLIAQKSSTKLNVLEKLLPLCKFELNSKFISFQSNKEKYQSQSRARLPVTCLKVEFETISFNLVLTIPLRSHCVKSFQTRSFFWSVFSPIWTEYGDLRSKSPYSVQIREIRTRIYSEFGHFLSSVLHFLLPSTHPQSDKIFVTN